MNYRLLITLFLGFSLYCTAFTPELTLDWTYRAKAAVTDVDSVDLNGDGVHEIIVGSTDGHTYALKNNGDLLWRIYNHCQVNRVKVTDLEDDGVPEVLAGGCRHLQVVNPFGTEIWKYNVGESIKQIIAKDLDGDGVKEIVMASESVSGTSSGLHVVDKEGNTLWSKSYKGTRLHGLAVEDVDYKPGLEIITGTKKVMVSNNAGQLMWSVDLDRPIEYILVDGTEILVGASKKLFVLSKDGSLLEQYDTGSSVWDVDSHLKNFYLASDSLSKISTQSDTVKWALSVGEDFYTVEIANLDSFEGEEVVSGGESITVLDLQGEVIWSHTPYRSVSVVHVADVDGDGFSEIIAGSRDLNVYYIKHTKSYTDSVIAEGYYLDALDAADANISMALTFIGRAVSRKPGVEKYVTLQEQLFEESQSMVSQQASDGLFASAQSLASQNRLDEAKDMAEMALGNYTVLGDHDGVQKTLDLLKFIESKRDPHVTGVTQTVTAPSGPDYSSYYWLAGILVGVILLAVFVSALRKKPEFK